MLEVFLASIPVKPVDEGNFTIRNLDACDPSFPDAASGVEDTGYDDGRVVKTGVKDGLAFFLYEVVEFVFIMLDVFFQHLLPPRAGFCISPAELFDLEFQEVLAGE